MRTGHPLSRVMLLALALVTTACTAHEPSQVADPTREETPKAAGDAAEAQRREQATQAARERAVRLPRVPAQAPAEPATAPAASLEKIKADAAARANVTIESVQVISSERTAWNDGSLGCPQPGEFYTQMLTSGYRVRIAAGSEKLDYRLAESGFFRLCADASALDLPDPAAADR